METTTYGLHGTSLLSRHVTPSLVERAEKQRLNGSLDDAIETCQQVLVRWPDYVSALLVLARIRIDLGDLEDAEETLKAAARHDPMNAVVLSLLARVYLMQGLRDDAERQAREALFFNPHDSTAQAVLREASLLQIPSEPAAQATVKTIAPPAAASHDPAAEIEAIRAIAGVVGAILIDPQGLPIDGSVGQGESSDAQAGARAASAMAAWQQVWPAAGRPVRALVAAPHGQLVVEADTAGVLIAKLSARVRPGRVMEAIHAGAQRVLAALVKR